MAVLSASEMRCKNHTIGSHPCQDVISAQQSLDKGVLVPLSVLGSKSLALLAALRLRIRFLWY